MGVLLLILFSQISIDIGRFKAVDDFTLCEFYISLPYSELSYKKEDSLLKSDFKLRVSITTSDSQEEVQPQVVREFSKISYINSYEEAESRKLHILDLIDLFLKPGKYEMKLEVISDSISKSVEKTFEIEPPQTELYLSDILLATSIESADSGKFVKNGLKIIPNPQAIFGEKYPTLYAYTEIYNLKLDTKSDSSYRESGVFNPSRHGTGREGESRWLSGLPLKYEVNYNIFNEAGDSLYTLPTKTLSVTSKDITETGGVDVSAFKQGSYILKVKVTQKEVQPQVGTTLVVAQKEKKFWVIKETKEETKFTAEELEYYHLIKYIAPRKEVELYNNLSNEAKHKYLINFWKRAGRPLLRVLIERIKYADTNFSSIGELGRDSDRGRISIRHGKPDETENFSFDRTYHSCEKWIYFGRGGIIFVFVDKLDDSRYELMYSSIPEEPTAPDYREWVNLDALP